MNPNRDVAQHVNTGTAGQERKSEENEQIITKLYKYHAEQIRVLRDEFKLMKVNERERQRKLLGLY